MRLLRFFGWRGEFERVEHADTTTCQGRRARIEQAECRLEKLFGVQGLAKRLQVGIVEEVNVSVKVKVKISYGVEFRCINRITLIGKVMRHGGHAASEDGFLRIVTWVSETSFSIGVVKLRDDALVQITMDVRHIGSC